MKDRFFNIFIAASLVVMASLLIYQAASTVRIVKGNQSQALAASAKSSDSESCMFTNADRESLYVEYQHEAGILVAKTRNGLTGLDGGLLSLRSCPSLSANQGHRHFAVTFGDLRFIESYSPAGDTADQESGHTYSGTGDPPRFRVPMSTE